MKKLLKKIKRFFMTFGPDRKGEIEMEKICLVENKFR